MKEKMTLFSVDEILELTQGVMLQSGNAAGVCAVSIDDQNNDPGALFVPVIVPGYDTHENILNAVKNGAVVVLTMKRDTKVPPNIVLIYVPDTIHALYQLGKANRHRYNIPVIAVTGSSGKTTTKDIIASVLSERYHVLKTDGNQNNSIGVSLTLLSVNDSHDVAVVEMGADHIGDIESIIDAVDPWLAVITNIGTAHLESFKSRENIFKAKTEIFSGMGSENVAVINGDDEYLSRIEDVPFKVVRYGISEENPRIDVKAENIVSDMNGVSFCIEDERFHFRLPGEHHVENCLAAITVAKLLHLSSEDIQAGLNQVITSGSRMKIKTISEITYIDDTYNANPNAMKAALNTLSYLGKNNIRRIVVLGDMLELGENSRTFHIDVGAFAATKVDIIIAVGNYASDYSAGAKEHLAPDRVFTCADVESAWKCLESIVHSGDIVLIKGSNAVNLKSGIVDRLPD